MLSHPLIFLLVGRIQVKDSEQLLFSAGWGPVGSAAVRPPPLPSHRPSTGQRAPKSSFRLEMRGCFSPVPWQGFALHPPGSALTSRCNLRATGSLPTFLCAAHFYRVADTMKVYIGSSVNGSRRGRWLTLPSKNSFMLAFPSASPGSISAQRPMTRKTIRSGCR